MRSNGFLRILAATLIAGVGGYAITWVAARELGPAAYADFASYWSFLYLVVGALSGVQQEAARASALDERVPDVVPRSRLMRFAAVVALITAVVVGIVALLLAHQLFHHGGVALVFPLALGTALYVPVSASLGLLYGIELWRPLSLMIVSDVVLRLAGIVIALALGGGVVALGWASVIPYPLTLVVLWLFVHRRLRPAQRLALSYPELSWNAARTVGAAAATAVLVSGFPVVLTAVAGSTSRAVLGALILAITLTRAPLVVSSLALQSYLVVVFKARTERLARFVGLVSGAIVLLTVILAAVVGWLGPLLLRLLFGAGYQLGGGFLAVLTASSAPTALLAITGSAVLARSRHSLYVAGWVIGAAAALTALALPLSLDARAVTALTVGPLLGVVVHLVGSLPRRRAVEA
jgi:O-antigen/teichoic acid export membrane protein